MVFLVLSFQLLIALSLFMNLFTFCETSFPPSILRIFRFGRSGEFIQEKENTQKKTPLVPEVPKAWFTHFYIFASSFVTIVNILYAFAPGVLRPIIQFLVGGNDAVCVPGSTAFFISLMFSVQIYRRLYECLYINKFSPVAKMNVGIYAIGFWHYFGAIVLLFSGTGISDCDRDISLVRALISVPMFVYAFFNQFQVHSILGSLRTDPNDKSYRIPYGGLFQYVSCPNYLCEIIIYFSICLMFGFKNYAFNWVALWVLANQFYSAIMSHQWYKYKFGSGYPEERKALIPYLF